MTAGEGQIFAAYLNAGGNLYLEGADTWYYDQQFTPTPVHAMLNIQGIEDGSGDLGMILGQAGSMVEDMSFAYSGDNSYIDRIAEVAPAQMMFMNNTPQYGAAVSFDAGTYRTVGFSFEFGGLQDGERTKDDLMIHILEFFGITGVWTSVDDREPAAGLTSGSYPNPFSSETVIRFETPTATGIIAGIYSVNGQMVTTLANSRFPAGVHELRWDGTAANGNLLPGGLYIYRIQSENSVVSGKLMLAR
jgi:hypothetical protein